MGIIDKFYTKAEGERKGKLTTWGWLVIVVGGLILLGVIIGLIVHFVTKNKEPFVTFNPSDAKHRKIDTTPVTTYLETYISSALGCDAGSTNPYGNSYVNTYKK